MTYHALVIDDDPEILEDVKDRLESLGHTCDCVDCQHAAHEHIEQHSYAYMLLDLEIPVRYGKPSRIQNGQNLLREIRATKGCEAIPIIVITAHGHDSPDLAAEVLRGDGADDFVRKPFPDSGRTLEKAVTEALSRCSQATKVEPPAKKATTQRASSGGPQPFQRGELVFFSNRVELCGVKILGDSGLGHSRRMLNLLRKKRSDGRFVRISGEELADKIGKDVGGSIVIGTITGCAKSIRSSIKERLFRDLNIVCQKQNVLVRDDQGYHFNDDKITVRDGTHDENGNAPGDIQDLNERQQWILEQTGKSNEVNRKRIEDKYNVSSKTAKRDFMKLVKLGLIEYVRKPHPGYYRGKQ
ncbi:MAG: response regulator [Planctomycetota bacterium]|nr:MAG: response regulator [Planctomycetota bacterium]